MKPFSSALRFRPLPELPPGHRASFAKPALRFFRTRTLVRVRFAPLRSVFGRS